jgi:hypothetical protein
VTWLGADPADPRVCVGRDVRGQPLRRVLGLWDTQRPEALADAARLSGLFPPGPDRQVEITRPVGPVQSVETWRWVPGNTAPGLAVPAGHLVLERSILLRTDQHYAARFHYSVDPATGAISGAAFTHRYGTPYSGLWQLPTSLTGALIEEAVDR